MRWVVGRFHNVYGPRMGADHVIPELSLRALRREDPFRLYGPAAPRLLPRGGRGGGDAAAHGPPRPRAGASSTSATTARRRASAISRGWFRRAGFAPAIERVPAPAGSVERRCPDLTRLRALTGFPPKVPLGGRARHRRLVPAWAAERGGGPVSGRRVIPNAVPHLAGNEWKYVKECLDTNWVSSAGPFIDRFERAVADWVGVPHAVATVNGSAALHVALLAAGVKPDDEVLVPTFTFIATANAVAYCGAHPVFLDVEPASWGLDPAKIADFLTRECESARRVIDRATGPAWAR